MNPSPEGLPVACDHSEVLPGYQKDGVGSAVIRTALAAARAQGEHLVVLVGHLEYYPRFGFRPASTFGIDAKSIESGPHLMALPLDDTPVPSRTIHYPPPWGV